ncbi:hypothetical protein BGX31_009706 [Mortierella sp. GBA43]|nr:hypothetical protein BGX31_009706 [Mortierella sp. GBA43]
MRIHLTNSLLLVAYLVTASPSDPTPSSLAPLDVSHCHKHNYGLPKLRFKYPKNHVGHALVLFNARLHRDIVLTEDKDELQRLQSLQQSPSYDPVESFLSQLDVWARYPTGHALARFSESQFNRFQAAMKLRQIPETERAQRTIMEQNRGLLNDELLEYGTFSDSWCPTGEPEEKLHRHMILHRLWVNATEMVRGGYRGDIDQNGDHGIGSMAEVFSGDWHVVESNLQDKVDWMASGSYWLDDQERYRYDNYYDPSRDARTVRSSILYPLRELQNTLKTKPPGEDRAPIPDEEWDSAFKSFRSCLMGWTNTRVAFFSTCEGANEDMDRKKHAKLDEMLVQCINDWNKIIPYKHFVVDLDKIDQSWWRRWRNRTDKNVWLGNYQPYEEIIKFYKDLQKAYPDLVSVVRSIGRTTEGRDIMAVKITAKVNDVQSISLEFAQSYGNDTNITSVLDNFELVIVPVINVDGYDYTRNTDRLWRKNRRRTGEDGAWGVDLNRNWIAHNDTEGAAGAPQSEYYPGPSPASEVEVQVVQSFFKKQKNVVGTLDFHGASCSHAPSPIDFGSRVPISMLNDYEELQEQVLQRIMKGSTETHNHHMMELSFRFPRPGSASHWFSTESNALSLEMGVNVMDDLGRRRMAVRPAAAYLVDPIGLQAIHQQAVKAVESLARYIAEDRGSPDCTGALGFDGMCFSNNQFQF